MSDNQWTWEPVGGITVKCDCGECDRTIEVGDESIQIYDDEGSELTAHLPDDYCLCRRVPAPEAGVPVAAIRRLIEFADEWGSIGDTEGMPNLWADANDVRRWLDSQEGK